MSKSTTSPTGTELQSAEDVVREHRELFEIISNCDNPTLAERYGARPLRRVEEGDR